MIFVHQKNGARDPTGRGPDFPPATGYVHRGGGYVTLPRAKERIFLQAREPTVFVPRDKLFLIRNPLIW